MPTKDEKFIPEAGFLNLPVPPAWKATDQLNAYESWVYTCINAIAQEVASTQFRLFKKKYVRGKQEIVEVTEHEALSLLYEVNPYSNYYMHIYETTVYLMLLGEAYWAKLRSGEKPISLWTLRPDYITIIPSAQRLIDHYTYRVGYGKEIDIAFEDMVPFRFPNPNSPYRGKSPVQSAARAIDTDTFSANWNRNFFFNSALPNMVLTTDQQLTEVQVNRLLAAWQAKFQGVGNAHKVAFLTGGFKPEQIGQKMNDMEFIEQRRAMRDEIMAIFKVPKTILGLTDDVNRANAEATKAAFIEGTITPILHMITSHLNEFYLSDWGNEELFFDFDDPSPEDHTMKLALYKNALGGDGNIPWMTINEVRDLENLEPVDGGDVIYLPFGVKEIGDTTEEPKGLMRMFKKDEEVIKLKANKKSKNERKFNTPIPPKGLFKLRQERLTTEIKGDLIKLVSLAMKTKKTKNPDDKKRHLKDSYWKSMVEETDRLERKMKEKLDDAFNAQQKDVMSRLREQKGLNNYGRKAAVNSLLFDQSEQDNLLRKQFADFIRQIVEQRALETFSFIGVEHRLNLHTTTAQDFLKIDGLAFIKNINETTREHLRESLVDGLAQSEGIDKLAERVERIFREAKGPRAEMIARTEVLRSTNFATQEAYRQSNVVEAKEWLTSLDACEECQPLDGQTVPLNGKFVTPIGSVDYPPLHPRCRCTTIPVLKTKSVQVDNRKEILNRELLEKGKLLEELMNSIEELKNEEKKIKKSTADDSKKIKDDLIAEGENTKKEIIENAVREAEEKKLEMLKEIKELRTELRKVLRDERE